MWLGKMQYSRGFCGHASLGKYGLPCRLVASQYFLVSPRDHFVCPVPSFSEMKEIG